ncbi:nuclear transport factor 2 family protein [Marinobacteraceae bacterium S3BR75-40.1]
MHAHEPVVRRFQTLYQAMGPGRIPPLEPVYDRDVEFVDPLSHVFGLEALDHHLNTAYQNVIACQFDFGAPIFDAERAALPWTMRLSHRRLRRGQPIDVEGMSHLRIVDDLVVFHRDYFDAAQLLYENIPVLGAGVRWVRRYAS